MDTINFIRDRIDFEIKRKGVGKTKLLKKLGIPINTYNASIYRKSLKVETLIRICKELEISPCSLFPGDNPNNYGHLGKYINHLESEIDLLNEKINNKKQ